MDSTVLVAIITGIVAIVVAIITKTGHGPFARVEEAAVWKDRFEVEKVKVETLTERLAARDVELAEANAKRVFAERESDVADRRLDAAYAELRATGTLPDRRKVPRD